VCEQHDGDDDLHHHRDLHPALTGTGSRAGLFDR
jgi:hypothetical protein